MVGLKEGAFWIESKLYKRNVLNHTEIRKEFEHNLNNGKPFMAARLGGNELWAMRVAEFGYKSQCENVYKSMCEGAGFFSDSGDAYDDLIRYNELMKESMGELDYYLEWQFPKEYYFLKKYSKANLPRTTSFASHVEEPWTSCLEGRKVLVIHPFERSIKDQYKIREKIYPKGVEVLPKFDLLTIKAIQTIAGSSDSRFNNWFEALDYMTEEALNKEFDIALIGCGAYGFPLAARIKKAGKAAVHMAGSLQLMFGIIGKRWDNDPEIQSVKNEFWKRPYPDEIPIEANKVEGGCYW